MKKRILVGLALLFTLIVPSYASAMSTVDFITVGGQRYQIGEEIVELRNQYSRTIVNAQGSLSTIISIGSVYYETSQSGFQPINTTIVSSDRPDWDWEVETGHWQLYVNNDMTIQVVKNDNTIRHQLYGIAYYDQSSKQYEIIQTVENRTPTVTGSEILWKDVLYGVDYRISYTNDSFKEDIIIKQSLRDLLNSSGSTPADYGLNLSVTYLMPIFRMDWSNALPMELKNGNSVSRGNSEHEQNIYFKSSIKDRYFNTNLVSYMPVDYATSVNPINPEDPEGAWEYAGIKMRKRMVANDTGDWLLAGIKFNALNKMPEGAIVFDPTETLRPDATGDETSIGYQYPDSGQHWAKVAESSPDEGSTMVASLSSTFERDLYNLPASSGSGAINFIKIYFRSDCGLEGYVRPALKSNSTVTDGTPITLTGDWTTYSQQWNNNPADSQSWEWSDIDSLQIGVSARSPDSEAETTQVYVVVDYAIAAPTVTTQAVTDLQATTATGNGNITGTGGEDCDYRGIAWDTTSRGDPGSLSPAASAYPNYNSEGPGSYGTGAFTRSMTGLTPGITHYARAYAHNSAGWNWGSEQSFATTAVPTVTTQAPTNTDDDSATGNGDITSTGGINCDYRGFVWDTSSQEDPGDTEPPATYGDNITEGGDFTAGAFTGAITDLIQGTTYHYRAYAHNTNGWSYGNEQIFVTDDVPTIVTQSATYVSYSTARLNSYLTDDGGESCSVSFQYNITDNWTSADNTTWVPGYTTGQYPHVNIVDLESNTLYYFRARAENPYGLVNATGLTFTTAVGVDVPSNFKAFPEATQVVLSWTRGVGTSNTLVRFKEGAYPTTISDGSLVYSGSLGNYAHTSLTSGHTYYYSAWGISGDNYTTSYAVAMATTLPASTEGEVPDVPGFPASWFQIPEPTVLEAFPFYAIANAFFVAYGVPIASGWFFTTILGCIVMGVVAFATTRQPMPAMIALGGALAVASLIKLLPMFMMAFAVVFMLGAFKLKGEG